MYSRSLIALFCILFLGIIADATALQLECTNDSRISPFAEYVDTTSGVDGVDKPNVQTVYLITFDDAGQKIEIPRSQWHMENPVMTYKYSANSTISTDTTPELIANGTGFRFSSPSDTTYSWVFNRFQATIVLDSEIRGDRLALRIVKLSTGSYMDTDLSSYTVMKGTAASWSLPDIIDMGDVFIGDKVFRDIPGPTGAPGSVSLFGSSDEPFDFIRINGCGKGCTVPVGDGGKMHVEVYPRLNTGVEEGVYAVQAEATLKCD